MSDRDFPDIHKKPRPTPTPEPEPVPVPVPVPTPEPTPAPGAKIGAPTGNTPRLKTGGGGGPWADVNQDDPFFLKFGTLHGVAPEMLKSMQVVESGGKMVWNAGGSGAFGTMQIKESDWGWVARKYGYDLKSREGQVATAAAILGREGKGLTPQERFLASYYPTACLDCKGEDGATPRMYLDDIATLTAIIKAALGGVVDPKPKPIGDPYLIITGGVPYTVDYGFLSDVGLHFYEYVVGHGGTRDTQHSGDDIKIPRGTKLFTPLSGVVTCVGTHGTSTWGQGCGSFVDDFGGVGNITILTDSGLKLTFGHCATALVVPGDRIPAGKQIGTSGTGNGGDHCHLDAVEQRNGTYWLLDPKPALLKYMGGKAEPTPHISNIIWEGTSNFETRGGIIPVAVVVHVTDDLNFGNVKSWFQNPASKASAHFVVDRDGSKHQFVGSADAAWTNGDIKKPRQDIDWLNRVVAAGGRMNRYTIGIENIGKPDLDFTPEQIASDIEIIRYYLSVYPSILPIRGHILRHSDINSVDRSYCPGPHYPLAQVITSVGGDPLKLNP